MKQSRSAGLLSGLLVVFLAGCGSDAPPKGDHPTAPAATKEAEHPDHPMKTEDPVPPKSDHPDHPKKAEESEHPDHPK